MSTLPSASDTVVAGSTLEKACATLRRIISPEDDDDQIKENLSYVWVSVHKTISQARPNLKERLRDHSEFMDYVTSGSNREQDFIKLLRNMAKQEVLWSELFENGTLLLSLWRQAH